VFRRRCSCTLREIELVKYTAIGSDVLSPSQSVGRHGKDSVTGDIGVVDCWPVVLQQSTKYIRVKNEIV